MLWFCAAASLLPFDKVMALFGNAAPTLALMVSMCMRLIPKFIRQGRLVSAVQGAMEPGTFGARAAADAMRLRLRLSTVLMGWGMEDSLQTADAMRARGWGAAGRRSTYTRYRFTATDAAALVVLALAGSFVAALAVAATAQFSFYPTTSRLVVWWATCRMLCGCLLSDGVAPARGEEVEMSDVCALEMRGLSFTYPGLSRPVLRDVSWRVPEGAFALLVGGTRVG